MGSYSANLLLSFFALAGLGLPKPLHVFVKLLLEFVLLLIQAFVYLLLDEVRIILEVFENGVLKVWFFHSGAIQEN